ncbi:Nucleoporin [Komagataella phaffii CBS 7435]|uniref:Nucleoporin involved in nucleocytoplasmic transport n=2 Tax=Komagataella phaffii TaxID=460519 RepID=C4R257_KOMPG|nr:Nucleoporin involved in nucleocytoplasmic transport [Komagataella phaffii GS115]AOA62593.1 GQ67_01002T0 [Komagataella phaffii]CAH2447870.1 Nucleoporin [Komagataella phaffii CBS 7435]AOA67801.1 GQ68_00387T0 [Komagataella phaffii GS115]CAY69581.1 Nucleoporin involved in nucleocytoplasmic transport [Komagataella phaffii GS115]CCA38039.1 Nucleoporin [Komagataella phaffii CBS 7435]
MSGKRRAGSQIQRETLGHDDDTSDEQSSGLHRASAEVLSKRKILKPRGMLSSKQSTGIKFSHPPVPTVSSTNSAPSLADDNTHKIVALNNQFVAAIEQARSSDPSADFTPILTKYLDYLKSLKNSQLLPKSQSEAQKTSKAEPIDVDSDSGSASEDSKPTEVKIQGPSFSLETVPTAKNSVFSFGKKSKPEIVFSDDSEEEVKVEGPSFTLSQPVDKSKFTGVFKFSAEASKAKEDAAIEPPSKTDEEKQPSAFESQPDVSAKGELTASKPRTLASSTNTTTDSGQKPVASGSTTTDKGTTKPFTFGTTASVPGSSKPFTFGSADTENGAKKFTFGTSGSTETSAAEEKPKPFTFGSSSVTDKAESDSLKPKGFTFGSNNENASKPFTFGETKTDSSSSKTFTFGSSKPLEPSKQSAFTFGGSASTKAAPTSSFGFTFSTPSTNSATTTATTNTQPEAKNADEQVEEVEVKGDFKKVDLKPIEAKESKTNETTLYEKRAKLMLYDPSNTESVYTNKGVGELSIRKNNDTGKARIVVVIDNTFRKLLNTAILAQFKYEKLGKGDLVKVPTINSDGKLETYVIKVKTAADGEKLLTELNKAKENV